MGKGRVKEIRFSAFTITRLCLPILLLAVSPPSHAKPKKETPTQQLLRKLNGEWGDRDSLGIRVEIRHDYRSGGTLYFYSREGRGKERHWREYGHTPFLVAGPDKIKAIETDTLYRIKFNKIGMDWSILGVKGKPRRWKRLGAWAS